MNPYRRLAIAFTVLIVVIILTADFGRGQAFFALINSLPYGDTLGHFLLLGLLSLLINLGFPTARVGRLPLHKASLLLAVLITLEEFSQILLANRTFSLVDLSANYAGIWLMGEAGLFLQKRQVIMQAHGVE